MGGSWAVYLAQRVHQRIVYSSGALRPADAVGAGDLSLQRPRHTLYIDDYATVGHDEAAVNAEFNRYLAAAMHTAGLPVKWSKTHAARPRAVVLGLELDGVAGRAKTGHGRAPSPRALLRPNHVSPRRALALGLPGQAAPPLRSALCVCVCAARW